MKRGFPLGAWLLALFVFLLLFGGARFLSFGFPILFFALPFFIFHAVARRRTWSSEPVEEESESWGEWDELPAERRQATDEREVRLQQACDQILTAYEAAPENTRAYLTSASETFETIRRTGKNLLARERGLRAIAVRQDEQRLESERAHLLRRAEVEGDPIARQRLESELGALEHRMEERTSILRAANRLDAEVTRLIYALEDMHTQMLRVGNAELVQEAGASEALRHSVESLRDEMGVLADALDDVGRVASAHRTAAPRSDTHLMM